MKCTSNMFTLYEDSIQMVFQGTSFPIKLSHFLYFTKRIALNIKLLTSRKIFSSQLWLLFIFYQQALAWHFSNGYPQLKFFFPDYKEIPVQVENLVCWKIKKSPITVQPEPMPRDNLFLCIWDQSILFSIFSV